MLEESAGRKSDDSNANENVTTVNLRDAAPREPLLSSDNITTVLIDAADCSSFDFQISSGAASKARESITTDGRQWNCDQNVFASVKLRKTTGSTERNIFAENFLSSQLFC